MRLEGVLTLATSSPDEIRELERVTRIREPLDVMLSGVVVRAFGVESSRSAGQVSARVELQQVRTVDDSEVALLVPVARGLTNEFAWVIEHCDSPGDRPLYWMGGGDRGGASEWSSDNLDAVRFARERDAAAAAKMWCGQSHRVREHGWCS